MTEPHWTQVLAALLTPIVAVFGSYIAYRQWSTAQHKLKLELFEKRFAVYESACALLGSIMTSGKVKNEETYKFLSGTREAKWLLNDDIATFFDEQIWKNVIELQALDAELEGLPVGEERTRNVRRQGEIKKWLMDQYKVIDEKFTPFLKLSSIGLTTPITESCLNWITHTVPTNVEHK